MQTITAPDRRALAALLEWYVENGVDLAVDHTPHDRYAERAPSAGPAQSDDQARESAVPRASATVAESDMRPVVAERPRSSVVAPEVASGAAKAAAAAASDLADLSVRFAQFDHAPFRDTAEHFLFAVGAPQARLMAFDAAPGATEESEGIAFCGPRARLLDNMLSAIGVNRENARLAYVAPWRPPGDKTLSAQETAIFAPFARRHVEFVRPQVLLLFGDAPARALLAADVSASKLRGTWRDMDFGGRIVRVMVFSSLDALLKTPAALKPAAWRDLRAVAAALGGDGDPAGGREAQGR